MAYWYSDETVWRREERVREEEGGLLENKKQERVACVCRSTKSVLTVVFL